MKKGRSKAQRLWRARWRETDGALCVAVEYGDLPAACAWRCPWMFPKGVRCGGVLYAARFEPSQDFAAAEATRASLLRRNAIQSGTCASDSPCNRSGPLNP